MRFSRATAGQGLAWRAIPDLGHGLGAVVALPQGRPSTTVADEVRLDYEVETKARGDALLHLHMLPTLDTRKAGGIRLAVSIDERPPQTLTLDLVPTPGEENTLQEKAWVQAVKDNDSVLTARFADLPPGRHVIRLWRLDDNALIQKLRLELAE